MRLPKVSCPNPLTILMLAITLSFFFVHADNPSPVGWNLSGGGFCTGDYTIFNTTLSPNPGLYAENCATGKNDFFSATDWGALFNSVRAALPRGGMINMRSGFYSEVTTATFNAGCSNGSYCDTALTLNGVYGGTLCCGVGAGANGTIIVAKTASMTMIAAGPWSASVTCANAGCGLTNCGGGRCPTILGNVMENLDLQANGLASIGIDFRMAETSTNNRFFNVHLGTTGSTAGGFKTASMILDGNEDTTIDEGYFAGAGQGNPGAAAVDVQWQTPVGNINIAHTLFGGNISLTTWSQIISIAQSTINNIKIIGTCTACGSILTVTDNYLSNQIGKPGIVILNGQTLSVVRFSGNTIALTSTISLYSGAGTVQNTMYASNNWAFVSGASDNWNAGGATLTKQNTDGGNHVWVLGGITVPCTAGACFTNFPFTVDANSNF